MDRPLPSITPPTVPPEAADEAPPTSADTKPSEAQITDEMLGWELSGVPGFEVLEELGRGGMGVVYKARQVQLDRIVALKVVLHAGHAGADAHARFHNEARSVARIDH